MPLMKDLLPEEDYQAYKATRPDAEPQVLSNFVEELPHWREQLEVMKYQHYSTAPGTADLLSMSVFNHDQGGAAARRFDSDLDLHYLNADGTFNQQLWKQDEFVLGFERAYYDNKGQVPLEFYIDNSEDLALLGGEFAEQARILHRQSLIEAERLAVSDWENKRFQADVDFIAEWQEVGEQDAVAAWTNIDTIIERYGTDWERGQTDLDTYAPGMDYAELYRMREVIDVETPIKRGYTYDAEEHVRLADGSYITRSPGDKAGEGEVRVSQRRRGYSELSNRRGDLAAGQNLMNEVLGTPMGWIMDGLGWGLDTFTSGLQVDEVVRQAGMYLEGGEQASSRSEAVQQMQDQIGMSQESFTVMAGLQGATNLWKQIPNIDPKTYNTYLTMAGGDEKMAENMFVDAVLFAPEAAAEAERQKAIYDAKVRYQIKELEDVNFTTGDALFQIIASWGEAMEFAATAVTMGLEAIAIGDSLAPFDAQFWQDVKDNETPAGVLGLEGTLIGLGLDLGATMLVDPTTYIFGPKLAAGGRAGVTSVDDAVRIANNAQSGLIRRELISVGRGASENATGYATAIDNLTTTGSAEIYMAATKGYQNPVAGPRPYRNKPVANAVDDVSYHILQDMLDEVGVDTATLKEAMERVKTSGAQPLEVTINPRTGARQVTKHGEDAVALQALGNDAIPTTFKVDVEFGVRNVARIKGMSDEASMHVADIADGTVAAKLKEEGKVIPKDRKAVEKLVTRGDEYKAYVPDPELEGIFGPREVKELGTVMSRNGDKLKLTRVEQGGVVDYLVFDVSEGGTGASMGGVTISDGKILMGLKPRARGSMDAIWDIALQQGDDLMEIHGKSLTTSEDAIRFAQSRANRLISESDSTIAIVDETIPTRDWAVGVKEEATVPVDGARHALPSRILGDRIYDDFNEEVLKQIEIDHYLAGGDPISGQRTVVGISAAQHIGDLLRNSESTFFSKLGEFVTPINSNFHFGFNGTGAMDQISQFGNRLWASARDHLGFEPYQARILDFYKRRGINQIEANKLTNQVHKLRQQHKAVMNTLGRFERMLDNMTPETSASLRARYKVVQENFAKMDADLDVLRAKQEKAQAALVDNQDLINALDDMMEEFNRRHLATNPKWQKPEYIDPETGLVKWEAISDMTHGDGNRFRETLKNAQASGKGAAEIAKGEAGWIPEEAAARINKAIEEGLDVNNFVADALAALNSPSYWNAPASPLELMTAAAGGPSAVRRVTHRLHMESVGEFARNAQMYWALDKVLTPRTAIVVSLDELMRIGHLGGSKSVLQLMEDKAMQLSKKVVGEQKLPRRWRDRLVALEEYPTFYRQLERSFLETNGYGFDTIEYASTGPKRTQYFEAAQRTSGQLLTDRGFQKFLQGEDAFREWFNNSTEAARLRGMEFLDPNSAGKNVRTGMTPEMAMTYYENLFERWALDKIKPGKKAEARRLWREAAEAQAGKGSTAGGNIQLPEWVLEGYGSVTGNANVSKNGMSAFNMVSDYLFQQPVNYRRGFLAEWTRKSERARLAKLYSSQGKKVVSDAEVRQIIQRKYPTWSEDMIQARIPSMRKELFERQGVITQSHMDELVEAKVISEMENALYSFQMNSRGGKAAKAVAPFGKPWADMMGFWGRELLSTPHLRGWINQANYMNMDQIAKKAADALPFNPKAAAFVSRIAATDFDLDRIQDDPIVGGLATAVGLEELDVGPALFLPHEGNNLFGVLLPGLGVIPVGALQLAFNHLSPDPVENPIEYQAWIDEWSKIMPGIANSQGRDLVNGVVNLVAGGGTAQKFATGVNAVNSITGSTQPQQQMFNGSWAGRIESNRYVKTLFTDVDLMEEFADLPESMTAEGFTAWLDSKMAEVVQQAQDREAWKTIQELGTEWTVPVRADYGAANDQLNSVWLESVETMDLELPSYIDTTTEGGKRQAADWARTQFFALEDWHRDALVAGNPQLAVNLVSMWEWTDHAKNQDRLVGDTSTPYRSGGSSADLARHETYQQLGYIQPVTPHRLAENIIGTIMNAKVQTARQLYTETTTLVNDQRWQHSVSDEWKDWFNQAAPAIAAEGELPYRTGRELWENYTKLKELYDFAFPPEEGETGFTMPQAQQAWGVEMPSDAEGLREEFEEGYPIPDLTDKMVTMAKGLGLQLDRPVFMENWDQPIEVAEIYQAVANVISNEYLQNPIYAHIAPGYKAWNSPRSAGAQATQEWFGRVLDNDIFDDTIRWEYKKGLIFIDEVMDRKAAQDPSWLDMRRDAVDRYMMMMQDDAFANSDVHGLWNQAYGKSLGPIDWEPPEPAPLYMGDGEFNPDASRVYVSRVVDGDTLDFTFGGGIFGDEYNRLRLLGYNAAELGSGGEQERDDLRDAVSQAIADGVSISVVRDPRYGDTDMFGRMYGWLYIGDEVWYNPDTMIPRSR